MWFVFPQVAGLGFSAMSQRYAIGSRAEAEAYLAHPVLGPRLIECTRLVLAVEGRTINAILGAPDDAKFRSSMTLFGAVSDEPVFGEALARYFAGERDGATLEILATLDRKASCLRVSGRQRKPAINTGCLFFGEYLSPPRQLPDRS